MLSAVARAALHVVALAATLWLAGYSLHANRWAVQLYDHAYFGTVGHWVAQRAAQVQRTDTETCLMIGPSTVREAFDEETLNSAAPGIRFLNGGVMGGTVHILDPISLIVEQSRVRPHCLAVGLNARMLYANSAQLDASGYTDFLDLSNGREIVARERPPYRQRAAWARIVTNTIWPYSRTARQLGRILRHRLHDLHAAFPWREVLPRSSFALSLEELDPWPRYLVTNDEPFSAHEMRVLYKHYELEGMYDPARYSRPEELATLRRVLDRLEALTPHLIIMVMPVLSHGRERIEPLGAEAFHEILGEYRSRGACVVDWAAAVPDRGFRDMGHLRPSSRKGFSARAATGFLRCLGRPVD